MAVDAEGLALSLGLNSLVCLVCFIVFSLLRSSSFTKKFYAPKRFIPGVKYRPEDLPSGWLSWLKPIWHYSEDELIKVSGLDAAVFVRIIKFGFTIFFWISLWCCIILLPVNLSDDNVKKQLRKSRNAKFDDIDKLHLTNVESGSPRLWVHAISVYVVTFIVLKLLWKFNQDLSRLRVAFLSTQPKGGATNSVLITDIPGIHTGTVVDTINRVPYLPAIVKDKLSRFMMAMYATANRNLEVGTTTVTKAIVAPTDGQSITINGEPTIDEGVLFPEQGAEAVMKAHGSSEALVSQEFKTVYGAEEVVGVNPVFNQEALDPVYAKYEKTKTTLTDLLDHYESRARRGKRNKSKEVRVIGPLLGQWGIERYGMKPRKVDALEHLSAYLTELKRQLKEGSPAAKADFYPSAFVTFHKRSSATIAASSLHSHDETLWRTQEAPGADEIVWENLRMRAWERTVRSMAMWALFVTIILFYASVCAALQGFVSIQQLDTKPFIKDVVKIQFVRGIVVAILPGLVLKIFLAILPMILSYMNRKAGMVSISQIDLGVVEKFFIFQFLTVFLSTAMAGTFLSQAKVIINSKAIMPVIKTIANGIPQQATFFMTYILLSGLAEKPLAFLRVINLVIFWVLSILAGTERAKQRLWANQQMMFGTASTDHVMAIMLGIVFCIQAPIIAPVCLYYFIVQMYIEKYNAMYVFGRPYESAGRLWAKIYRQIMVSIYTFQIVIILQLGLKAFPYTPLLLPVPTITFVFDMLCTALFKRPWTLLSLRAAAELDRMEQESDEKDDDTQRRSELANAYLSPVFKVSDEEHAALMTETESMQRRLRGEQSDLSVPLAQTKPSDEAVPPPAAAPRPTASAAPVTPKAEEEAPLTAGEDKPTS